MPIVVLTVLGVAIWLFYLSPITAVPAVIVIVMLLAWGVAALIDAIRTEIKLWR